MIKTFIGTVVSLKMKNTAVVKVERKFRHHKYQKVITRHKKFHAHNEIKIKEGDIVKIKEVKPISKTKRFLVSEKVNK